MEYQTSYDRPVRDHTLSMDGRKRLDITGVKQVDRFDNEEFLLETSMGFLAVRGHNLQMKNLDVEDGNVSITGRIDDIVYLDQQTVKPKSLIGKLFK
ncbi:sporulation protein YabP [Paenalkalicoccus suaedae]|uniref:Sporulation protein YabP n=1 Tax=Paenalkalicoccus suaedae TaxID=2592382 RepID=A0A859F9V3_9BACI|nr:sporulation protein YabP [Paenalkalicoccus suaedae]QKS69647.1 sporulation protein YabP [Paenalkalicoccus suaedae]